MADFLYKRMKDDTEAVPDFDGPSQVQAFYAGKTIFLTGCTGFLGKLLVEKLLRSLPDLKTLYVLVRAKRGLSMEERMEEYLTHLIFDRLKKERPDSLSKLKPIAGDLMAEDMAISAEDRKILIDEVNFIIHNAANVKFNTKISTLYKINVLGTLAAGNLGKECKNMQGFTYVSTAFSQCIYNPIEEKVYPAPADLKKIREVIERDLSTKEGLSQEEVLAITGKYPNTYTYTKATAEGVVDQLAKEVSFKCAIFRPSVVISTWKEPIRSWCDAGMNGPMFAFVYTMLGVIRVVHMPDHAIDYIPADMTINGLIVSMWDAVINREPISGSYVYNYTSGVENPMTMRKFKQLAYENGLPKQTPSIHVKWTYGGYMTTCKYYAFILDLLFHALPTLLADVYMIVQGKKPQYFGMYRKVMANYGTISHFMQNTWQIPCKAMIRAAGRLNKTDENLFYCDIRKFDWADYSTTYWNGMRVHTLQDPMSTVPAALEKYRRFEFIEKCMKAGLVIVFAILVAFFFRFI